MDLIRVRDSAFFTTLLHCVLAYSIPNENLPFQPGLHSVVSSIPNIGIPETSNDKTSQSLLDANFFMVNPSWHRQDDSNSGFDGKVKNDPSPYNPPDAALKGMGLKYPLAPPRVKLTFAGTSGMLPVNTQYTPTDKPKPPKKVLKPTVPDLTTKPGVTDNLVNSIKGFLAKIQKSMQPFSSPPNYSEEKADELDHPPTYPSVYSEAILPINKVQQAARSHKLELSDIYLNPTNIYPQTIPEINYRQGQQELTSVTPSYKYFLPGLGSSLNPNINYSPNPVLYSGGDLPERANRYIPYGPNEPETRTLEPKNIYFNQDLPTQLTKPHKAYQPGVLKPINLDYVSTKPSVEKDAAVVLPPVPSTMSLLRRTQLVLLNTVAGLPGGNPQALASLRAG